MSQWLKASYHLDYIDMVTEPGADKALLSQPEAIEQIMSKVLLSVRLHGSNLVALAGHHDCAANPVSEEEHRAQIRRSLQVIRFRNIPVTVVGLWVNERWAVEVVSD